MSSTFDPAQHRDEVVERWGADAAARSDSWWRGMDEEARAAWQAETDALGAAWIAAADAGEDPTGAVAQELAARHVAWLRGIPGTPASDPDGDLAGYVTGLAEMYVADERFAANYGGVEGATFVRDALIAQVSPVPEPLAPEQCPRCRAWHADEATALQCAGSHC